MEKLSVDFSKLTRREQLIYSHAKFSDHFKMTSDTITAIETWMGRIRVIWLIVVIVCTGWLVAVLARHGLSDWNDYIAAGTVIVTFTAGRYISFLIMDYTARMLHVLRDLLSHLADDASLKLSFEDMASQNGTLFPLEKERRPGPSALPASPDSPARPDAPV